MDKDVIPNDWNKGLIVKLPKKEDLQHCDNLRGIALLSVPSKIFCRVLLNRIEGAIDVKLRQEQVGFWSGKGCTDQIFAVRNIIEQSIEWSAPGCIGFIYYNKAFDKMRLFNSNVISVLLYGCQRWRVNKNDMHKLDVFQTKCLRRICNIFWPNKISNEDLYRRTNSLPIRCQIQKHIMR